jgi:putative FmdB family regulatory protein
MPFYEYQAKEETGSCPHCARPFTVLQRISDPPLTACPQCGKPLTKLISAPNVGSSKSSLDSRAKSAGFTKFQKLGKGEYEKKY